MDQTSRDGPTQMVLVHTMVLKAKVFNLDS